jgi:hypothetical protein
MATLAVYLAGLCDHSDTLEKGLVLWIAPDIRLELESTGVRPYLG